MNRDEALHRLRETLPRRNLYDLARGWNVTIERDGHVNKGWVGQTIEHAAGLTINSLSARDGSDFELKSTTLQPDLSPKETIRITQLNPEKILQEEFETSALWKKLERLILVGCHHPSDQECYAVQIAGIDVNNPDLVEGIRAIWEDVRYTVGNGEIALVPNLGSHEDLIQLRPTGDGKQRSTCPVTGESFPARAFYGTKRLLREIWYPRAQ